MAVLGIIHHRADLALADESRRAVEAAAQSKQSNLAGGYAGADDALAALAPPPASHGSFIPKRVSSSFIDGHIDETPLGHLPLHATQVGLPSCPCCAHSLLSQSQRALMTEEGCEIDMQQIKFMEELGEGAFGKVYHCLLWEVRVLSLLAAAT